MQTHTFVEGIKNPALNAWGWFNDTYQLVPTNYVMYAKCANGIDVVKFWAYDYYQNNAGGNVSLRYETGFTIPFECQGLSGDVNLDDNIIIPAHVPKIGFSFEKLINIKTTKKIIGKLPHLSKFSVTYPVPDKIEITLKEIEPRFISCNSFSLKIE